MIETVMLLALLICGEAGTQDYYGQRAVGQVVENRVRSEWYPDTFEEVIWQPYQFSAANDEILYHWNNGKPTTECYQAAHDVYYYDLVDYTGGALFYHSSRMEKFPRWSFYRDVKIQLGSHIIY